MLDDNVEEGSAANLEISFFDEADPPVPVTPNAGTIFYSVRDNDGEIVGDLKDEPITPEAEVVHISIDGSNNMITDCMNIRCVRVVAQYDSATYGADRDITIEFPYEIDNHKGVPTV